MSINAAIAHVTSCADDRRIWLGPQDVPGETGAMISVHALLTYDDWTGRTLGSCSCHVAPVGRGFETQPVNDLAAEGRRMARFVPHGHAPGFFRPVAARMSRESRSRSASGGCSPDARMLGRRPCCT